MSVSSQNWNLVMLLCCVPLVESSALDAARNTRLVPPFVEKDDEKYFPHFSFFFFFQNGLSLHGHCFYKVFWRGKRRRLQTLGTVQIMSLLKGLF